MNHVDIFDFDGVLASPFEEALFTMDATIHDPKLITRTEKEYGLNLSLESRQSARYISIQAALMELDVPIQPGISFPLAGRNPYHILTARCDRFAVTRMHMFLMEKELNPIKTMHTDHLEKGKMLEVLLARHPDVTYNYFEDNPRHIESAMKLKSPRLNVYRVDNHMESYYLAAHKFYIEEIIGKLL